jgi:hypothetical protein
MNSLTVITEEAEDEIPEECSELVAKLKEELNEAHCKIDNMQKQLERFELNETRVKELMGLCQSKNTEIFALERKVKDLHALNEDKDKQIISMLSMVKDFKFLVESEDKIVQTDLEESEARVKILQTEEKNEKIKELIVSQNEEILKLKDLARRDEAGTLPRKKVEVKRPGNGYCPLFLRKPKDSMV